MLDKLAFRNMKRSARDYGVYSLTIVMITALMYAFNSLIFQNSLSRYVEEASVIGVMIGLSTVFIVLIVAWLINYIVRFMLEKRSREFGIYLLLGMKKKTIAHLYMKENLLLGGSAFLVGILVGVFLQQILCAVMFSIIHMQYRPILGLNWKTILMTALCFGGCYLLALLRSNRQFKKMNIYALIHAGRKNEEIREKNEEKKKVLFPLAILFLCGFWVWFGKVSSALESILFVIGLVLTIYLFYTGLSSWIVCYIRKRGNGIYKGQNLFLLRQFSSKVRVMRFTMGTLTALFTVALLGASTALMFSDYQSKILKDKFPFDVQVHSRMTDDDFTQELTAIEKNRIDKSYSYNIYTNGKQEVNAWMLTHTTEGEDSKAGKKGPFLTTEVKKELEGDGAYYSRDTYMELSTYNRLRAMLGYKRVRLKDGEYRIHTKARLKKVTKDLPKELQLTDPQTGKALTCAGIGTEPFSQDGHNGADYVIVVPDEMAAHMTPYYRELAVITKEEGPAGLTDKLEELGRDNADPGNPYGKENEIRPGSDQIVSYTADVLVKKEVVPQLKFVMASVIIPLFYIGLVFVCVAVTVLSVQHLSDADKYRFRYDVLFKMGLKKSRIQKLIFWQLLVYYLAPAVLAVIISGKMVLYMSAGFIRMTGLEADTFRFLLQSVALFMGIYTVYFVVTSVSFQRSVFGETQK